MTDYKDRVSGCATDIDWSKAPDWATKHGYIGALTKPVWFDDEKYTYVSGEQGGRSFTFENEGFKVKEIQSASTRPAPQWNGEGLPPVGTECEAAIPHVSGPNNETRSIIWIEGAVIAYHVINGKTYAWFAEGGGFYPPGVFEFRPRRTPAQIAAEEREAAIEEIEDIIAGFSYRKCAELVYDAGYRKGYDK